MGIETIVPFSAFLVGYIAWRLFLRRKRPGRPSLDADERPHFTSKGGH